MQPRVAWSGSRGVTWICAGHCSSTELCFSWLPRELQASSSVPHKPISSSTVTGWQCFNALLHSLMLHKAGCKYQLSPFLVAAASPTQKICSKAKSVDSAEFIGPHRVVPRRKKVSLKYSETSKVSKLSGVDGVACFNSRRKPKDRRTVRTHGSVSVSNCSISEQSTKSLSLHYLSVSNRLCKQNDLQLPILASSSPCLSLRLDGKA